MKTSKKEQELQALISSLVPTPANLLVSLGDKKAKKIQDTSGQTLLGLSKSANRLGLLEKMLVDTLNSVLTPYSKTWRVKVTTQGHLLFQLHPLVRGTKEKDSGLLDTRQYPTPKARDYQGAEGKRVIPTEQGWSKERDKSKVRYGASLNDVVEYQQMYPTPTTQEIEHPDMKLTKNNRRLTKDGKNSHSLNLADTVKMYPTPRACDLEGGVVKNVELQNGSFSRKNKKGVRYGVKLKDAVHHLEKMYPTPQARDYKDTMNSKPNKQEHLLDRLRTYPTPTSRDHKGGYRGGRIRNGKVSWDTLDVAVQHTYNKEKTGGKLNPNFVEFLMGFPLNWTKIESEESKD